MIFAIFITAQKIYGIMVVGSIYENKNVLRYIETENINNQDVIDKS